MKQPYKLLIADDERRIRSLIRMYLERDGALIEEADNGEQAVMKATETHYDIIIMDWMMPGLNGLEACQIIKGIKKTPVIFLTGKNEETDRLLGFEAGVDDYLTKPFSPRELSLRVRAILKRSNPVIYWSDNPGISDQIVFKHLIIEHGSRRVIAKGKQISLTLKEYELLRYFSLHIGITFTREALLKEVWNYGAKGDSRTVDTHIKRIREKLQTASAEAASMIRTVWGIGYRMDEIP